MTHVHRARALIVMAKAPKAGDVKTRLSPPLSLEDCARLQRAFLEDTLSRTWPVERRVLALAGEDLELAAHAEAKGWRVVAQGQGDLGARMDRAMMSAFESGATSAAIIGSDIPHLSLDMVESAYACLEHDARDLALVAAEDGGYALVASNDARAAIFNDMAWSQSDVLARTLHRAVTMSWSTSVVGSTYDVDTVADLRRLWLEYGRENAGQHGSPMTRTRTLLTELEEAFVNAGAHTEPEQSTSWREPDEYIRFEDGNDDG